MYTHSEVDIEELDNIVYDTLVTDSELFSKYHIFAPCTINKGLKHILDSINEFRAALPKEVRIYKLHSLEYTAGFFVVSDEILYSFGISKHHRCSEAVEAFWRGIDEVFEGRTFLCTLHNKNTRAIDFLLKGDGEIIEQDDKTTKICL